MEDEDDNAAHLQAFQILAAGTGVDSSGPQLQHFELVASVSREPVHQILFSAVLMYLITVTSKSIVLWDCATGHLIRAFHADTLLGDHAIVHPISTV